MYPVTSHETATPPAQVAAPSGAPASCRTEGCPVVCLGLGHGAVQRMVHESGDLRHDLEQVLLQLERLSTLTTPGVIPDATVASLRALLGRQSATLMSEPEASPALEVGGLYDVPEGWVVKIVAWHQAVQVIGFVVEEGGAVHWLPESETRWWQRRRDLRTFPEVADPVLPFVFDLLWDFKQHSDLRVALEQGHPDEAELRELMAQHHISLDQVMALN